MTEPPKKRVFHKKKSDWATAQAEEKRQAAQALRFASVAGKSEQAKKDKWRKVRALEDDVNKFEQLARKYRAAGE